jgi:cysteine-rich repeat protein
MIVENGWTCEGQPSVCNTICGDQFFVGNEKCEDGDKTDEKGCEDDCLGVIKGWVCTGEQSTV